MPYTPIIGTLGYILSPDRGRVLIRASGTEPKLRLMVEAEQTELAQAGIDTLLAVDLMK